ncbi:arginyl-tRNA--protein transferase 1-like [Primulina eburnea]|uniref:arginyl-tRNA--protein transferase 1-like n=1 Tax=Primulina eburnea TaxID=1245227 RepID=UPI003C6CB1F3
MTISTPRQRLETIWLFFVQAGDGRKHVAPLIPSVLRPAILFLQKNKFEYQKECKGEIDHAVQLCMENGELSSDFQLPKASVKRVAPAKRKLQAVMLEDLTLSCNIAFQIAATLRRTRKDVDVVKSSEHGSGVKRDSSELSPKTIAEILGEMES